ncbi:Trypanosomal VSG domain/Trypanosome variant surface glycoprotein C-terminal domain containing protein, putative [Trypanosoma equiperdum]|uniref:Trypanosomal VSG domain/Trypanosome variant surface glycoprotein C-terminal domain containing protein, putative n=1 Tax=Trypanosoma equiperdum TaxID=5694 RepID=A0A1G4HZF8_TRYEQ|nr:Trypanosomal VSG domain/Trypanosome variant surface glycoprotein C-terminal domain containing protein, putative [Trypanosoma equiperdum]
MQMATLLLIAALVLSLSALKRVQSNSADNDNIEPFSALCALANLAQTQPAAITDDTQNKQLTLDILAANLSVSDQNFTNAVLEDKDWSSLTAQEKADRPGWENNWPLYKEAKSTPKTRTKEAQALWATLAPTEKTANRVRLLSQHALELFKVAQSKSKELSMTDVTAEQNLALYGTITKPAEFKPIPASKTREDSCGKSGADADNKAGSSIYLDITCLCAKHGTSTATHGKACVNTCTATNLDTPPAADTNYLAEADNLLKCCQAFSPHHELNEATVTSALATFIGKLKHKQGSTTKQNYVLGELDTTGEAGCTGNKASNGGKCAAYKPELFTKGKAGIPWAEHLVNTAQKLQNKYKTLSALHTIEAQLRLINATVHSYLYQNPVQVLSTTAPVVKKQLPTEAECNKHTKSEKCNDPCKWNGNATDANKKCSLDPAKAAEQQATKTVGAGAGAATTSGCARHQNQPDCESDKTGEKQNCAWRKGKDNEDDKDTEKCRNGSFLLNKQFALSVVSSAFVGLIF